MITDSQLHYLNVIHSLKNPTVTLIAKKLDISKPSVVKALKKLKEQELVNYDKEISLTEKGTIFAKNYAKRKNTIKKFLIEVLKIDEEIADIDSEKMINNLSCISIIAMEEYISKVLNIKQNENICKLMDKANKIS